MDVLSQILKDLASLATTKLLAAILAAVLVVAVGKILLRLLRRSVGKTKMDTTLQKFLISAVKVVIYFVAAMIVAGSLGFEMSSLVALASVVSAAFALAASDTLSNLFGGILLLMTKPFGVNDYVSISGQEGTVRGQQADHHAQQLHCLCRGNQLFGGGQASGGPDLPGGH